ncbi:MAG: hypothetical protein KC421_18340 [Anaerolineales bacterium]|nr:hypothetical protein [Anaerolineales bacterium]
MSGNNTWRNWVILFALLIVFALVTAFWSSLTPDIDLFGGGGGTRTEIPSVPVTVEPIEFEIAALGIGPVELAPIAAIGILAAVAVGGIVVVGAVIAFINLLLSRQVTAVIESDDFKEKQAQFEQTAKAKLKQMNEGRPTSTPDHNRPVWSAISTSLIVLFFVWLVGMIINFTIYPEGQVTLPSGGIVNTAPRVIVPLLLIALLFLSLRFRPKPIAVAQSNEMEESSIPWDTIAVLFLGLLVVGLGLATMMFLI